MSKLSGYGPETPEADIDPASGLLKKQRMLAEAVETTCSANEIHRDGVLNMQHLQYAGMGENFDILETTIIFYELFIQIYRAIANWYLETRWTEHCYWTSCFYVMAF